MPTKFEPLILHPILMQFLLLQDDHLYRLLMAHKEILLFYFENLG